MTKIIASIVSYQPDLAQLNRLVSRIAHQVDTVLVIDNNSTNFDKTKIAPDLPLNYLINDTNIGLASAYNQAIDFARSNAATHLILFDQDSLPAPDMISSLLKALTSYNADALRAAAAGPNYTDIKGQSISPFVRISGFKLQRVDCSDNEIIEIDHLISSGKLIDLRAISIVGKFTDELFIDYVDTEWGLRARHNEMLLLGVGSAKMTHNIGEKAVQILGRQVVLHSPLRLYYQFRNQIWLMKQPWAGWRWRIIDIIRLIKLLIVLGVLVPNRRLNLPYILKGIKDGVFSHMGKYK